MDANAVLSKAFDGTNLAVREVGVASSVVAPQGDVDAVLRSVFDDATNTIRVVTV